MILRLATLVACALVLNVGSAGATRSACPAKNSPNELVLAGGSGQTAQLGKPFETPLQVQLANTNGCPLSGNLAGYDVNFDAPGTGPSGIFSATGSREAFVGTNAQGVATAPTFVANDTAGAYTVDAHSDFGSVELYLSNTASGLPAAVTAAGETSYEAAVDTQYPQALQVHVTDANGNPVQGAAVTFAVVPGPTGAAATFLGGQGAATTDSTGLAVSPALVANGVPGKFTAVASVDGVAQVATWQFDNHAAALTVLGAAGPVKATVGRAYRAALRATVLDASGQPVEGATVTFALAPSAAGAGAAFSGGGTQATALTDADGVALSPRLTANKVAGAFEATATAAGAAPARYALTNLAGAPAAIAAGAGAIQSTAAGTRFAVPLAVTVTDRDGNAVPHAVVTFAAPAKGASGRFGAKGRRVRVRTNANGVAVAPAFRANRKPGGYVVRASTGRIHVAFALVNA